MKLQEKYKKEVLPALKKQFGYKNDMAVPHIDKVVLNIGIGKFNADEKILNEIVKDLTAIAGQKPVYTLAKKAIAGFKIRQGMKVGLIVNLRGRRAYDFIERLVFLTLPRTRDFRGIEQKSIDKSGTLNLGIREQIIFPEISHENIQQIFSLQITVKTTAINQKEGIELLKLLGFPIKN